MRFVPRATLTGAGPLRPYSRDQESVEATGTFDANGWLTVGFSGHQPSVAEPYISTGSTSLCSVGLLPLGLPATEDCGRPSTTEETTSLFALVLTIAAGVLSGSLGVVRGNRCAARAGLPECGRPLPGARVGSRPRDRYASGPGRIARKERDESLYRERGSATLKPRLVAWSQTDALYCDSLP
jgi:hypothetical protein